MNVTRKLVTSILLLALLFAEACTKKRPPVLPKDVAPTIAEALPEEIPEKKPEEIDANEQLKAKPSNDTEQAKKPTKKPAKPGTKKTSPPASTTVAATPAQAAPLAQTPPPPQNTQTVASVRPHTNSEPAPDMTVAAAISSQAANKQKEDTARMVDTTESALKGLTRQLNDEEKGMRTQVETYLQQSRKATADGDYERAFKLAEKAQVLVGALTKQ